VHVYGPSGRKEKRQNASLGQNKTKKKKKEKEEEEEKKGGVSP